MPDFTLAEIVGRNITERRHKLEINQKELSVKLKISQDAMARMEKGKIAPKMSRFPEIAKVLGCSVAYLFRQHDEATDEIIASIADTLKMLPSEGQEAIRDLVEHTARVMLKNIIQSGVVKVIF
jgi:transcriptional regulator with XRE-family HTH domain